MTALALDRNRRTAMIALVASLAMVGLAYASVPLYRLFCQVTGYGGTTMRVAETGVRGGIAGTAIEVRFDANHSSSLPWSFKPELTSQTVAIGARNIAFFTATNLSDKPVTGTATYNVTPTQSGAHFAKIQCFCFNQQTLAPGQSMRMPVIYTVQPSMLDDENARDVRVITLSYTFYPVDESEKTS